LSFKWSLSLGLSHQKPVHVSPLCHACYMLRPPHFPWFDLPNDIWWWVHLMKLPTVQLSPLTRCFMPLRCTWYAFSKTFTLISNVLAKLL
jgi:hypothetical protein